MAAVSGSVFCNVEFLSNFLAKVFSDSPVFAVFYLFILLFVVKITKMVVCLALL